MAKINLNFNQYLELEKLGLGIFKPVENFMNQEEFVNVINNLKFKKKIFPLPIFLDINQDTKNQISNHKKIILKFNSKIVGYIINPEIFTLNKKKVAIKIYGTNSNKHPGVNEFYKKGSWFIGGKTIFKRKITHKFSKYEVLPSEIKKIIKKNKLKSIVGFQTRNVPHKAHEYLIRNSIENYNAILIQPLIGQKKIGDYSPDIIMQSFNSFIKNYLPSKKIILSCLTTFMRYAGPKEAIFHAIIRRNYGCTHFIVGRDHAGVGNFYKKYEAQNLLKKYEKYIGIKIIYSKGPYFCAKCDQIVTSNICRHSGTKYEKQVSGTYIRSCIINKKKLNKNMFRADLIRNINPKKIFINE